MTTRRRRSRSHRETARQAQALRRAMSSTTSMAVRNEMLAAIGR